MSWPPEMGPLRPPRRRLWRLGWARFFRSLALLDFGLATWAVVFVHHFTTRAWAGLISGGLFALALAGSL